jgi:hypothetical protein
VTGLNRRWDGNLYHLSTDKVCSTPIMAKTTKKTPSKQGSNLLNFFAKPNEPAAPGTKRRSTVSDVKPVINGGKGKGSSAVDPLVISDDEEPKINGAKRRKLSDEVVPPPIVAFPSFTPPPNWPGIINTAPVEEPEGYEDGEGYNRDPDGDGSQLAVDEEDLAEEEIPEDMPSLEGDAMQDLGESVPVVDDGIEVTGQAEPPLDLGMQWDEGDDEGMGMEEDDEVEVVKEGECPVCGKVVKGDVSGDLLSG